MRKAMTAVLEQDFNNHTFCSDWCPALFWKDNERVSKALKYRCKEKNSKLYKQLKTHHDKFVTDEWMKDLMDDYDSNKPKSFNRYRTKFLPKHKIYASTILNWGRTYLSIKIDSVGYLQTYRKLFTLLGIEMTVTMEEHHWRLDRRRDLGKKRKACSRYKQKRNEQKNKKISDRKAKLAKDNAKGFTYATEMAGPSGSLKDAIEPKNKRAKSTCEMCGLQGHSTRRAKACKYLTNVA
jgi:hypothetical protein